MRYVVTFLLLLLIKSTAPYAQVGLPAGIAQFNQIAQATPPPSCNGTNYYVTSGAAGGGNGSIGSPWNSIAQVNNFRSFGANACVNFNSSAGTFNDAKMIIGPNITAGLTTANAVVFQPASGQSGWRMQAVDSDSAINFTGGAAVTVTGATLRGNGSTCYGVHVTGMAPGSALTNSNVNGFTGQCLGDVVVDNGAGGTDAQPFVIGNNVIGGTSTNQVEGGIKLGGTHTTAIGNQVAFVGGGIGMCCAAAGTGNFITNNLIHDIIGSPTQCGGFGAIELDAPVAGQVIARNEMYNVMIGLTSGCDGTGVDLDGSTGTTIVEYNFGHHNAGASFYGCIGCYSEGGDPWGPSVFRYNISENDGFRQPSPASSGGGMSLFIKEIAWGGVGCTTGCTVYAYGNTIIQNTPGGGYPALILGGASPWSATNTVIANNIFAYTTGNYALVCNFDMTPNNIWRNNNFWNMSGGTSAVTVPSDSNYNCRAPNTAMSINQFETLINNAGGNAQGDTAINPLFVGPVPFRTPSDALNSSVTGSTSLPASPNNLVNPPGYALASNSPLLGGGTNPTPFGVPQCSNSATINGIVKAPCVDFYGNPIPTGSSGGTWSVGASQAPSSGSQLTATNLTASGGALTNGAGSMGNGTQYTLTMLFSAVPTVTGGSSACGTGPSLTLNDGGIACYVSTVGSSLTFRYTPSTETTSQLSLASFNLNGGSVTNNLNNATVAITNLTGLVSVNGFYTAFPSTASPITGASWTSAGIAGGSVCTTGGSTGGAVQCWGDVQTTPGIAFGHYPLTDPGGGDATAVLAAGTYGATQEATGIVSVAGTPSGTYVDPNILLNATISSGSITGYKGICSVQPGFSFASIRRLDGAPNAFTDLVTAAVVCNNGDTLKLSHVGSALTLYQNGTIIAQTTDSTYTNGRPGMGFYNDAATTSDGVGFSAFTASSIGGGSSSMPGPRVAVGPQNSVICPGGATNINPGTTIQTVVNAHAAGTNYCLTAGTFTNQSVTPKNGDVFTGQVGAIMDGGGGTATAFNGNATGVTVQNIVITNYKPGVQRAVIGKTDGTGVNGWTLKNLEVKNAVGSAMSAGCSDCGATAIAFQNGSTILANYLHDNASLGFSCYGPNDLITDNEIARNNPWSSGTQPQVDPGWEAGGNKCWNTNGETISYNYSHDNGGPGLWFDSAGHGTWNTNATISYNVVSGNYYNGIMWEVSKNATISYNNLSNNGGAVGTPWTRTGTISCATNWLWCAEILSSSSAADTGSLIDIHHNTFAASSNGAGISVISQNGRNPATGGDSPGDVRNAHVYNNTAALTANSSYGIDSDYAGGGAYADNNFFHCDSFTGGQNNFFWNGGGKSLASFQSNGQENNGGCASIGAGTGSSSPPIFSETFANGYTTSWNVGMPWEAGTNVYTNASYVQVNPTVTPSLNPFSTSGNGLQIVADRTNGNAAAQGKLYYTGLLSSKQTYTYGYFEFVSSMPLSLQTVDGANWLYPNAASGNAEIDVIEHQANVVMQTVWDGSAHNPTHNTTVGNVTTLHTYAVDWQSDFITFYIDNVQTFQTVTPANSKGPVPFMIILSVNIRGGVPTITDGTTLPQNMTVKSVNVWANKAASGH